MSQPVKFLLCLLALLVLNPLAESAVLDLSLKNMDGSPAPGVIFQIFPQGIGVNDNTMSIAQRATGTDGRLRFDLKDGQYTLVASSQELNFLIVREVSVPGSLNISVADTAPVIISCSAADGSPIVNAEIFFRPARLTRSSVGFTDNSGSLKARVSDGEYHVVLRSCLGAGPQ